MRTRISDVSNGGEGAGAVRFALSCLIPFLVALVLPAVVWDEGCIEREALTFIRQYRADRSALESYIGFGVACFVVAAIAFRFVLRDPRLQSRR